MPFILLCHRRQKKLRTNRHMCEKERQTQKELCYTDIQTDIKIKERRDKVRCAINKEKIKQMGK